VKKTLEILVGLCIVALFAAGGVFGTQYLLSGEGQASQGSGSGDGNGRDPVRVGVTSPELRMIEDDVTAVGTMRPVRAVELVPSASGRVTDVPVGSTEQVEEGQLLIQLDDRAERGALAEAEATLSEAEQDYRRIEELAESNTAAEAQLEEARATFRRAEAAAMQAEADLEDRAITAPFAGTLGVIDTEPGAFLDAGEVVTRLSDLSAVEVEVSLPERYFDRIEQGQTVYVTTPAFEGEIFEGRLSVISPEIDLTSRSFDIRAEIDNPDRRLVGGMFANARVVIDTYEGLAVPDDAIISEGLTSYVYTISDNAAQRTSVEPGASLGSLTEVSGLSGEDRVVVAGWDNLSDGSPVEIDENFAREGLE